MALPNMKSYVQAVVRPMMKALEAMYAADVKYMEEMTALKVDELKLANAKLAELTELVGKLQISVDEYEEELSNMRKRLTANEAIKQLTTAFYRLLEHNRRIFNLEADKYQQSRQAGKIEIDQSVQDQRIAELTTKVRTATNTAANAVTITDAKYEQIQEQVEKTISDQQLADAKIMNKIFDHNRRIFDLEVDEYHHDRKHIKEQLDNPTSEDMSDLNTKINALTTMVNQLNEKLSQIG